MGLSRDQIIDLTPFPPEPAGEKRPAKGKQKAAEASPKQLELLRFVVAQAVEKAWGLRQQIHAIGDPPDNAELRRLWKDTNDALDKARVLGDGVVAAYFGEDSDKARTTALSKLRAKSNEWLQTGEFEAELRGAAAGLREGERPLEPFHWEIEFPEVFGRANPGFDCFVGNPPFLGGTIVGSRLGLGYHDYLVSRYPPSSGLVDLVAFFLRRAFEGIRSGGTLGLITTNTISQRDTRGAGLEVILRSGGVMFAASRRHVWPGEAAVVVSIIHIIREAPPGAAWLDGEKVSRISAFLVKGAVNAMPPVLRANMGISYVGAKIWGAGFLFEREPKDGSSAIDQMYQLLEEEPHGREVVFPYVGGEEFNTSPCQAPNRFVIDFGSMTEEQARRWPKLFQVVEERVRPIRLINEQRTRREYWWLHASRVLEAIEYMQRSDRMLALTQTSKHLSVAFVGRGVVASNKMILFLLSEFSSFAVLQSGIHRNWVVFLGSTMKDDPVYTTSNCFETFPFPSCFYPLGSAPPSPQIDALEAIGKEYYEFRAASMADETARAKLMDGTPPEGLTKTYNKFHDRDCHMPGIIKLRELHAKMDRAVLDAYGWQDIKPEYDFREQLDESIRLTWSEDTRDEVLARLLELNRVMAEQEAAKAKTGEAAKKVNDAAKKAEKKLAEGEAGKPGRGGRKRKDDASLAIPGTEKGE